MYLSVLWHLHQPIYRHPDTREYILPWVNFHLTKNYYQMAYLAEETGYPCTFNLVPCLIEQIQEYARGEAVDSLQKALEADPGELTAPELARISKFLPPGTEAGSPSRTLTLALKSFFSPVQKTSRDQEALLDLQKKTWKEVVPFYKKLWQDGRIELTTSAYYHPLLPLIFDLRVGGETTMPKRFFLYPDDGKQQIKSGREYFRRVFGRRPSGIWPSEGGISGEVAEAMAAEGYAFAVTDENILWKTLKHPPDTRLLYRPYTCRQLTLFFRDRELSDLISFEYHRWPEKDAVSDLLAKLQAKGKNCPEDSICVIALDGENPWAGYRENGVPFLREFYGRILRTKEITPIFLESYLALLPPRDELDIVPGTWLGSFSKWVGCPAKNAAWDDLSRAREKYGPSEELAIAEGSDWFWWFGEENVAEFEALFRGYLKKAGRKREKAEGA
ncbi:MAG: glycoside hydrolase family 57 protein [Candidatus Aminicenantes bacterium]|nr:glycoside hydrolase family 57 protein [Candidatus Aminicenantes bacterium]